MDANGVDGSRADVGPMDSSTSDASDVRAPDVTVSDTGSLDAAPDSGTDSGVDAGHADVVITDAHAVDAGTDVPSAGGCISGAPGSRAVRFSWQGSGPGSTAYVRYEANQLPDTSRWHVSANSMSIGYTPVFDDTFLGIGGLDLEGTGFIDVELSTSGLSAINGVTIAIFGRSFNTTASGSFSWQTFTGPGAAPTDLVWNSAPYQWYGADATASFVAGDAGVLLRIYPGPSSDALIVNRVEICFDAL